MAYNDKNMGKISPLKSKKQEEKSHMNNLISVKPMEIIEVSNKNESSRGSVDTMNG